MRRFLFLQGPSSPFFGRVARELRRRGAETLRVGACPGDRLYWPPGAGDYVAFRGRAAEWQGEAGRIIAGRSVTDLVCLGDGRPFHRDAIAAARRAADPVNIHIVEQGYLRPGLITVEPEGMGANSLVPGAFMSGLVLTRPPAEPRPFRSSFLVYAGYDIAYHASNLVLAPLTYPHYRNHALNGTLEEWRGWIGKAVRRPERRRRRADTLRRVAARSGPLFVFPLQLETDYQIRQHGYRDGLRTALADIVASFRAHSAPDAVLVVKVHPMDNGLTPWRRILAENAEDGKDRILFLDGGDLDRLIAEAAGIVTVNSTVGLAALAAGRPVKVLGTAIYDLPAMTDGQPLDRFWQAPAPPDAAAVERFLAFLKPAVQVPGAFEGEGAVEGARNVAERLLDPPALAPRDRTPAPPGDEG